MRWMLMMTPVIALAAVGPLHAQVTLSRSPATTVTAFMPKVLETVSFGPLISEANLGNARIEVFLAAIDMNSGMVYLTGASGLGLVARWGLTDGNYSVRVEFWFATAPMTASISWWSSSGHEEATCALPAGATTTFCEFPFVVSGGQTNLSIRATGGAGSPAKVVLKSTTVNRLAAPLVRP